MWLNLLCLSGTNVCFCFFEATVYMLQLSFFFSVFGKQPSLQLIGPWLIVWSNSDFWQYIRSITGNLNYFSNLCFVSSLWVIILKRAVVCATRCCCLHTSLLEKPLDFMCLFVHFCLLGLDLIAYTVVLCFHECIFLPLWILVYDFYICMSTVTCSVFSWYTINLHAF